MTLKPARLLVLVIAASLALFPQTAKKSTPKAPAKTAAKKTTPKKTTAKKTTGKKTTARKTTRKKTTTARRAPARQAAPDRDRIIEIQQALTDRGYAVEPNGTWGPQSVAALKQFQEDHDIKNLSGRGKLDPLTLIALGLGPKHNPPATPETPAPPTPNQEGQNP